MNPFFGRTLRQTQRDAVRNRDALLRKRGVLRMRDDGSYGFEISGQSSQPSAFVDSEEFGDVNGAPPPTGAKKTNYIPYVIGGLALLYFATR